MRAPLALVLALLAAGCAAAAEPEPEPLPLPREAAPRTIRLDWRETHGSAGEQLVFEVLRFVVRDEAWEADVGIENRSSVAFAIGRPGTPQRTFGLMLFRTDDLAELEDGARTSRLPPVRDAKSFAPELPERLAPGESWRGTMSAHGSLPAGLYVRVVFGRLLAETEEAPASLGADISWITDHAVRL